MIRILMRGIQIADRVTIMNNGQIVFDGLPEEARASNFWHCL
jgi:ABC-type multidrug transport system ATPase subunit